MKRQILSAQLVLFCLLVSLPLISEAQEFCWKDSYGRGVGTVPKTQVKARIGSCPSDYTTLGLVCAKQTCKDGKEADGGLCYKECRSGYKGVGPVCWAGVPEKWVECGMGAAKDSATCGIISGGQVVSALSLAYGINTELTRGQPSPQLIADMKEQLKTLITIYNHVGPIADQVMGIHTVATTTGQLEDQTIVTAEDILRLSAQIAALIDPTGVSSAAASYTYPTCDKYFPDGTNLVQSETPEAETPIIQWGNLLKDGEDDTGNQYSPPAGTLAVIDWASSAQNGVCQAKSPHKENPFTYHPGKLYDGKCHIAWNLQNNYIASEFYPLQVKKAAITWRPYSLVAHQKGIPLPALTVYSGANRDPKSERIPVCMAEYQATSGKSGWHPGKFINGTCRFAYGSKTIAAQNFRVLTRNTELWETVDNQQSTTNPPNAFLTGYEKGNPLGICKSKKKGGEYPDAWHAGKLRNGRCEFAYDTGSTITNSYKYLMEDQKDLFWVPTTRGRTQDGAIQQPGALFGGHEYDRILKKTLPLYICRAVHNNAWHAGKVSSGSCHIAYGNSAVVKDAYEVLLINRLPKGFAECAGELSPCFINGTVAVYFGDKATDRWTMKQQTGNFVCNLQSFGDDDPAVGVGKACYIPENAIPQLPLGYTNCAPRGGVCTFKGTVDIFYGTEDRLIRKTASSGIRCDDSAFGGDPAPGHAKSCYIPSTAIPNGVPVGLRQCAMKDGVCLVPGTAEVFYGNSLSWHARQVESETVCSPDVFGTPLPQYMRGEAIRCMIKHNVAAGKPVTQSSVDFGGVAERAVDGSADGIYSDNSVTHTSYGPGREEWLEVDLEGDYRINAMKIYNRLDDCCKNRIINARVEIYSSQRTMMSSKIISHADDVVMFDKLDIGGRYVRIIGPVGGVVSVAEVEVFGTSRL